MTCDVSAGQLFHGLGKNTGYVHGNVAVPDDDNILGVQIGLEVNKVWMSIVPIHKTTSRANVVEGFARHIQPAVTLQGARE